MKTEKVNSLLTEMVSSQGFINIDQGDVDSFKTAVGEIDAEKVSGKMEDIGVIFDKAISSIRRRNDDKHVKGLLFVIRVSKGVDSMENISDIHDVIDNLGEEIMCKWGFSTMNDLMDGYFEIIAVVGFKKEI